MAVEATGSGQERGPRMAGYYMVRLCPGSARGAGGRPYSQRVDDVVRDNSEKLAGLLQGREGLQHGTARLTISPEMDGFLMCMHDQERGEGSAPELDHPAY